MGAVLFLIYRVITCPKLVHCVTCSLYADDTTMYSNTKSYLQNVNKIVINVELQQAY